MSKHERMFHHGHAHKLDDPERGAWLPVDDVLARLGVRPGMNIADIGAGTGYFALPLARAVAPTGKLVAVDLQPEMLDLLRAKLWDGAPVELVVAEATRTTLPDTSQDLVLLANVWHEIDDRGAALGEIARILRADGRVAILDWRSDVASPPGPPIAHRLPANAVGDDLRAHRFGSVTHVDVGTYSYLVIATRPEADA